MVWFRCPRWEWACLWNLRATSWAEPVTSRPVHRGSGSSRTAGKRHVGGHRWWFCKSQIRSFNQIWSGILQVVSYKNLPKQTTEESNYSHTLCLTTGGSSVTCGWLGGWMDGWINQLIWFQSLLSCSVVQWGIPGNALLFLCFVLFSPQTVWHQGPPAVHWTPLPALQHRHCCHDIRGIPHRAGSTVALHGLQPFRP